MTSRERQLPNSIGEIRVLHRLRLDHPDAPETEIMEKLLQYRQEYSSREQPAPFALGTPIQANSELVEKLIRNR
jgi:hypothetical protein